MPAPDAAQRRRLRLPAAVLTHLVAGTAVHALAHGCLPAAASLIWLLPVGTVTVAAADMLLSSRGRAVRAAGGQLAVHGTLTALAACIGPATGPHASGPHDHAVSASVVPAALMLLAHALAVVVCLLLLERVEESTRQLGERAAEMVSALAAAVVRLIDQPRPPLVSASPSCLAVPLLLVGRSTSGAVATRGPPAALG